MIQHVGVGKFLLEAIEDKIEEFYTIKDGKLLKKVQIIGYDKMMSERDDITIILAKANMLIYFSNLFKENNELSDVRYLAHELLNNTFKLSKNMLGTLEIVENNKYDLIMANPPYYQSRVMREEANKTGQYTLGGAGVEALFLEWILKSLAYGGTANVVLPDGIFSNDSNRKLKEYIINNCYLDSIISLPVNTFFNTPKKTYILTIKKKTEKEIADNIKQNYPVFTYICTSIGETLDTYRFDDEKNNDLHEAVCKYNNYKNLLDKNEIQQPFKTYFNTDKKFKSINIEDFSCEKSWIIENWWSEDEKVEIGLKKQTQKSSIEEFEKIIDETIDLMKQFKEDLECMK